MLTAYYNRRKLIGPVFGCLFGMTFFTALLIHHISAGTGILANYVVTLAAISVFIFFSVHILKMALNKDPQLILDKEGMLFLPLKNGPLKMGKIKWGDIASATTREGSIKFNTIHVIELKLRNEANDQFKKSKILYFLFRGKLGLHCTYLDRTKEEICAAILARI